MSVDAFVGGWQPCLGTVLLAGRISLLPLDGAELYDLDIVEVVLEFGEPRLVRCLSWEQTAEDWELSVREGAYLTDDSFPEVTVEQDGVLSSAVGKQHTALELYAGESGELKAAALYFGAYSFIIALGRLEWDAEKQVGYFNGFWGDDIFVWTPEQFVEALRVSPLSCVKRVEVNASG